MDAKLWTKRYDSLSHAESIAHFASSRPRVSSQAVCLVCCTIGDPTPTRNALLFPGQKPPGFTGGPDNLLLLWMPFSCQHSMDHMIDEVILEPRCLSQYSFLRNPQPFWNGAAAYVPNSTMNLDAVQLILYKRVRHQHFACPCHNERESSSSTERSRPVILSAAKDQRSEASDCRSRQTQSSRGGVTRCDCSNCHGLFFTIEPCLTVMST